MCGSVTYVCTERGGSAGHLCLCDVSGPGVGVFHTDVPAVDAAYFTHIICFRVLISFCLIDC